jgi:hypothetical protein
VGRGTPELYLQMAATELHGVSPSYEVLCRAVAESDAVCALLNGLVDDPATFLDFVICSWEMVEDTMLTHQTQTNEPGRCATLLPLLVSLPQPLALVEVGASAGLCLYPDRYSYRFTTGMGDHRLGETEIVLPCAVTGPPRCPSGCPKWGGGPDWT